MAQNIAAAQRRGQKVVEEFNKQFTPNTPCFYQPVRGEDKWYPSRTRSEAWLLGHGEPVVKIDGATGCVCISHLAMPGSDRYEVSICEADEARAAHTTQRLPDGADPDWVSFPEADSQAAEPEASDHLQLIAMLQKLGQEFGCPGGVSRLSWLRGRLATLEKLEEDIRTGNQSDGYHTFNELYAHRVRLFACLMHAYRASAWWSFSHADGGDMPGWIIAGIDTPAGTATYHLPESEIDNLPAGTNIAFGKEWDGHTADDVLERLLSLRRSEREWPANNDTTDDLLVYQYSVWVNTERGRITHDGVILLPMIRGIEGYLKARDLIAADMVAAGLPATLGVNALNVTTLNAVGEVSA